MPLHLESMTDTTQGQSETFLSYVLGPAFQTISSAFATEDKLYFIGRSDMIEKNTRQVVGQYVYTLWSNLKEQRNEVIDIDIILNNTETIPVHFLERLSGSSNSNEYYEAETADTEQHFQLETVCRHTVSGEIAGTVRNVRISVFPFKLNIYDSISSLNQSIGFKKAHTIGKSGLTTDGLSETFIAPGGLIENSDDSYSVIVGTVESFKDVAVSIGRYRLDFVIAQVRTALGVVPVAMGRDVFDIEKIKPGMIVGMCAYVKVDLSNPSDFRR